MTTSINQSAVQSKRMWDGDPLRQSTKECFNCRLPRAAVRAKVKLKAENSYHRDSFKTLPFCSEECALQLPTRSTRDSIARILHGRAVTLSEFRSMVSLDTVEPAEKRLACPEMGSQVADSTEAKNGKNELIALPYMPAISGRVGRPRRWHTEAERKRAYRRRERNGAEVTDGGGA